MTKSPTAAWGQVDEMLDTDDRKHGLVRSVAPAVLGGNSGTGAIMDQELDRAFAVPNRTAIPLDGYQRLVKGTRVTFGRGA
jgi:hypothetical protein